VIRLRTVKVYKHWESPSIADNCYIHGWRIVSDDWYTWSTILPIFRLDGSLLLPTDEFVQISPNGPLRLNFTDIDKNPECNLRDRRMFKEDDINLIEGTHLHWLDEYISAMISGLINYQLWRNTENPNNREVVVVMIVAKEEPSEEIAPPIIEPCQRCELSPTGLHVRKYANDAKLNVIGEQYVSANLCKHCGHVLASWCFPD